MKTLENMIDKKQVLKGVVTMVYHDKDLDTSVMAVDYNGIKCVIPHSEVEINRTVSSLVGFIGREINFLVEEICEDKGYALCSRMKAQELLKEEIVERLIEGEVFNAKITNSLKFGAYVEIDGVAGLLKNKDFSTDHTSVGDVFKIGEDINVRLKKITANNKLILEAVEKYTSPTIMNLDEFERDQVILGTISNIQPRHMYVSILPNLDALCPIPATGEYAEGLKVSFRITQVIPEERKIRGKILRVVG